MKTPHLIVIKKTAPTFSEASWRKILLVALSIRSHLSFIVWPRPFLTVSAPRAACQHSAHACMTPLSPRIPPCTARSHGHFLLGSPCRWHHRPDEVLRAARNRSLLAVCSQLEPKPLHFIPCKAAFIIYSYTATQPVLVTCGRTDDLRARFQPFQNLVDKGLVVHPLQYARVYSVWRDERPCERIWGAVSYIGVRENHAVSDWPSLQRGD
jgi:hypothetical protein